MVASPGTVQGVGEPRPADLAEERVGTHLVLELGPRHDDDPEGAVPGALALGVVQDDEAAAAQQRLRLGGRVDLRGERQRVRGDPGGCRDLVEVDLRPLAAPAQAEEGLLEVRRDALTVAVHALRLGRGRPIPAVARR